MKQIALGLLILFALGCSQQPSSSTSANLKTNDTDDLSHSNKLGEVDTAYINGVIWTGRDNAKDASVLLVDNGKIVYVDDRLPDGVQATTTVDLAGRFMMHGFIDNHVHFFDGGSGLSGVQLRDAATQTEFVGRIKAFASALAPGEWVLNGNWDHELWGGELPDRQWIDGFTQNTPVFIMRLDGHMALANTAALEAAGIRQDSVSPEGGEIIRDATGRPTGVLKDAAMNAVLDVIPSPSESQLIQIFENAQAHALSLGVTKVHAMTAYPSERNMFELFQPAHKQGLMKMRVRVYTPIEFYQDAAQYNNSDAPESAFLQWGGVKGLVDGALGSSTAWFYEPFVDLPESSGFSLFQPAELTALLQSAHKAGLKLAIHGIGDKAIDTLISEMTALPTNDIRQERFRIEHFQHPTAAAINRVAELGIIAAMHPYHAIDDGRWAEKRIGAQRIKTTYAFRSVLDAGGRLSFGSDWPVAPLSPMQGVYAAVTRRTIDGANPEGWQPQEKITVEEALRAYTVANAYAGFEDDVAGTLEVGKRADMVVLSADPRSVQPTLLAEIQALKTYVDGELVYAR